MVSDLHKGVKIFAFFRGSRAGLIELQNTKLEEKKRMAWKKKPAAWDSKDYETENGKYSSHVNSGCHPAGLSFIFSWISYGLESLTTGVFFYFFRKN